MSVLSQAIEFVNQNHPLPRCEHGQALRDHSGELLDPPCGCTRYRTVELDYDARRQPRTNRSCVRCQKDIKPASITRHVHVVGGGTAILHPADEIKYAACGPHDGDCGSFEVGMDCARIIGMEWTTA